MRHRLARREKAQRRGRRLDFRRVIHKSVQSGGMPIRLAFRRRREKPVRLIALLDVSGSMSPYSTFFVRFLKGVLDSLPRGRRLRLPHPPRPYRAALGERTTERAIERLALMAQGWSGGTRIGESLADLQPELRGKRTEPPLDRDHRERRLRHRPARATRGGDGGALRRRARRIVWLNPMLGWQGYEPVARGMAAALPHVDLFAPAHNLESLAALEP